MDVDGIYQYTLSDADNSALSLIAVRGGRIRSGNDEGRVHEGTYRIDADGVLQASITTSFAAGCKLLGRSPGPDAWQFTLEFAFTRGRAVQCFEVETPVGPLELAIEKLVGWKKGAKITL